MTRAVVHDQVVRAITEDLVADPDAFARFDVARDRGVHVSRPRSSRRVVDLRRALLAPSRRHLRTSELIPTSRHGIVLGFIGTVGRIVVFVLFMNSVSHETL